MKNDARRVLLVYVEADVNQPHVWCVIEGRMRYRAAALVSVALLSSACAGADSHPAAHPAIKGSPDPPGTRVFKVDSALSTVSYTVTEHVPTITKFHPALGIFQVTGKAPLKGGSIHVTTDPSASAVRGIRVDPLALKTDIVFRDANVDPMLTSAAGDAEFDSTRLDCLPSSSTAGAPLKCKMSGQLQVHGVVKIVDFAVTAALTGDRIEADATGHFDMTLFDVSPPSGLASDVDPGVTLTIHLVART